MLRVSIVKGKNRKENLKKAISLIEKDIAKAIRTKKSNTLFIKINAIDSNFPLACTHIEALEAVLDVFYEKFKEIVVGDNTFVFTKNKGVPYNKILKKFPEIKFSDLTEFESENIEFKKINRGISVGEVSLLSRKAFTISLALPKTHDTFVYTGCLKNMFGCVIKNRGSLHAMNLYDRMFLNKYAKGNQLKWENLIEVIEKIKPDLCILDGYEGMEGNGPMFGTKVHLGLAMCSLDGIVLDKIAAKICGFNNIPYLLLLSNKNQKDTEIVKEGFDSINEISKKFKPHYNYKYQITTKTNFFPLLDVKLFFSLLRRSYRLKDKIISKFLEISGEQDVSASVTAVFKLK